MGAMCKKQKSEECPFKDKLREGKEMEKSDEKMQLKNEVYGSRSKMSSLDTEFESDGKQQKEREDISKGAHKDFSSEMSYGSYLNLDKILSSQKFVTDHHDEALFIIIHQVSELWIKLFLFELQGAQNNIRLDNLRMAFKMISRGNRILDQLVQSWSILATMTPIEFQKFRDQLGHSSGFQSYGYREIEYRLGNKNQIKLIPHEQDKSLHDHLSKVLKERSLYDEVIVLLSKRGFKIDKEVLERDVTQIHQSNNSVKDAWFQIYKNNEQYFDLYELAEKLVDIEDLLKQWRYRHLVIVNRTIGTQKGTGGTDGGSYLEKALQNCFFPELWEVRSDLFSKQKIECPFNMGKSD